MSPETKIKIITGKKPKKSPPSINKNNSINGKNNINFFITHNHVQLVLDLI